MNSGLYEQCLFVGDRGSSFEKIEPYKNSRPTLLLV